MCNVVKLYKVFIVCCVNWIVIFIYLYTFIKFVIDPIHLWNKAICFSITKLRLTAQVTFFCSVKKSGHL